ncbi:MAG: PTS IIA-like nitrogen regulatory protein PtsN [Pseudomonadota bacterium]
MDLSDLISPDTIVLSVKANSKKQALQELAAQAARAIEVDQRDIFDTLLQRERLGSTGVGRGVAIPHGKLPGLDKIFCLFARLDQPIDFDTVDDEPVDLLFVLLAPESAGADHLKALARISRLLREPGAVEKLRRTNDVHAVYAVLTDRVDASSNAA